VKEVPYARASDINFKSARQMKAKLDAEIDKFTGNRQAPQTPINVNTVKPKTSTSKVTPPENEMNILHEKFNNCKVKPVALSLVQPHSEQFVLKSRSIPTFLA
jgi:hypothetical protein